MIKLTFKDVKKNDQIVFINKNVNMILSKKTKTKKSFQKKLVRGSKIFLMKKKTKSANMLVSDIEICLKKKKTKSVNMFVNDFRKML